MTALNVNRHETDGPVGNGHKVDGHGADGSGRWSRRLPRLTATSLLLGLLCVALPAAAANQLRDIQYSAGADGAVDITLQFAQPVGEVQAFTTDNPPRIAIDFPDTANALAKRRVTVGSGATSAVSAAEANGRTRVVVDLFRPTTYKTRAEGNNVVLSIAGAAATQGQLPLLANPADPAKRIASGVSVSNIDFRRGDGGSGRVIVRFDGDTAAADMRMEGSNVVIDVANAQLPANLQKRLDVTDFATPVASIDARNNGGGTRLVISTSADHEALAYQTGNEYVVEIAPKASADSVARRGATADPRDAKQYKGKPVTFNFQDIPVRTVLQLIAEESNLNIVAADSVQGNVTVRLVNVPWDQALDIVLRAKSLDQRRDGNVVWVAPQQELASFEQAKADARIAIEERAETITEYIPINYGNAEDIAKLLTEDSKVAQGAGGQAGGQASASRGFLSSRGSISFDTRTNTLLVVDIPQRVASIKQLVMQLDKPVDQVLIEARIVIASESFARELGARFGVSGQEGDVITSGSHESNTNYVNDLATNAGLQNNYLRQLAEYNELVLTDPNATRPKLPTLINPAFTNLLNVNLPTDPSSALALTVLGNVRLDLEINALQQEGRGEVISNPRIITSNQREAVIRQGDEIGYVTLTAATPGSIPTPNVQFKDVLLELKVTPTITQDDRVFLAIAVKKDELAGFLSTSIGDVPRITKREVNTAVLVDDGQTVVIGGVYEYSSREDLSKTPFLGDIPILGNLFKTKTNSTEKAELLIFISPKILTVEQRG